MLFAKMDILSGESFYQSNFKLKETQPLNFNMESFGYESKNYFLNSGSIFLLQSGLFAYFFGFFVLNKLMTYFPESKLARMIGMKVYVQDPKTKILKAEHKLYLESYFEITMCSTLNLLAFIEATDAEDLRGFFNTPGNLFCSCVAMTCLCGVFLFPLWGHQ
jgi:hypothetical protein